MCLSIPIRVSKIKDNKAISEFMGKKRAFRIDLVPDIGTGDYALASNGFITKKISDQEAKKIFEIIKSPQSFDGERRRK